MEEASQFRFKVMIFNTHMQHLFFEHHIGVSADEVRIKAAHQHLNCEVDVVSCEESSIA